jgi:spore coat polysaccharide biosynthesis protein SpsF
MPDVIIRCDASVTLGLGHLTRAVALAVALQREHGVSVELLMTDEPSARAAIDAATSTAAVTVRRAPLADVDRVLVESLESARALILDHRGSLDDEIVTSARRRGRLIATLDDPSPRRRLAQLAFYPPMPQVRRWDWNGFDGELYVGWEWVVLRHDLSAVREPKRPDVPRVLMTFGGSDPADISSLAFDVMERAPHRWTPRLVLGGANPRAVELMTQGQARQLPVRHAPADYAALMAESDIAVVAFGVSAYELAACRIPALYACLTPDHLESARAFEAEGLGRVIGLSEELTADTLWAHVGDALTTYADPMSWLHRVPASVDTNGASRIAATIVDRLR